jgi:hypothetical protein
MDRFAGRCGAAIAYAAIDDLATATRYADTGGLRAALAGYLVGATERAVLARPYDNSPECLVLINRFAQTQVPPDSGHEDFARHLLADVLFADCWYEALPVLAKLEPDAVLRVRDIVFAHIGLEHQLPE